MRSIAIGLNLKIENILIKGFNNKFLGSGKLLVIKIANLGIVRPPFEGSISVNCNYILNSRAYVNFKEPGISNLLKIKETLVDKENTIQVVVKLINKDIPEKDIETVYAALNPVSELRPSALELLNALDAVGDAASEIVIGQTLLHEYGVYDSPQRPIMLPTQSLVDLIDNAEQNAACIIIRIKMQ
ncbi:hypothetical protein H105_01998 [Trichophyton soudanense CBS 452.61]|uniref:Uncharacterized protein n=1 Tax=Trichophyton soudanense CBS 452.61 TaxID=1215331 RepID=A0A022Y140_TRISD|nr:hypothetical protein H105_01998 [Trichophyton soudanense CBS 452.61]